jgi:hypothetical protein
VVCDRQSTTHQHQNNPKPQALHAAVEAAARGRDPPTWTSIWTAIRREVDWQSRDADFPEPHSPVSLVRTAKEALACAQRVTAAAAAAILAGKGIGSGSALVGPVEAGGGRATGGRQQQERQEQHERQQDRRGGGGRRKGEDGAGTDDDERRRRDQHTAAAGGGGMNAPRARAAAAGKEPHANAERGRSQAAANPQHTAHSSRNGGRRSRSRSSGSSGSGAESDGGSSQSRSQSRGRGEEGARPAAAAAAAAAAMDLDQQPGGQQQPQGPASKKRQHGRQQVEPPVGRKRQQRDKGTPRNPAAAEPGSDDGGTQSGGADESDDPEELPRSCKPAPGRAPPRAAPQPAAAARAQPPPAADADATPRWLEAAGAKLVPADRRHIDTLLALAAQQRTAAGQGDINALLESHFEGLLGDLDTQVRRALAAGHPGADADTKTAEGRAAFNAAVARGLLARHAACGTGQRDSFSFGEEIPEALAHSDVLVPVWEVVGGRKHRGAIATAVADGVRQRVGELQQQAKQQQPQLQPKKRGRPKSAAKAAAEAVADLASSLHGDPAALEAWVGAAEAGLGAAAAPAVANGADTGAAAANNKRAKQQRRREPATTAAAAEEDDSSAPAAALAARLQRAVEARLERLFDGPEMDSLIVAALQARVDECVGIALEGPTSNSLLDFKLNGSSGLLAPGVLGGVCAREARALLAPAAGGGGGAAAALAGLEVEASDAMAGLFGQLFGRLRGS